MVEKDLEGRIKVADDVPNRIPSCWRDEQGTITGGKRKKYENRNKKDEILTPYEAAIKKYE